MRPWREKISENFRVNCARMTEETESVIITGAHSARVMLYWRKS